MVLDREQVPRGEGESVVVVVVLACGISNHFVVMTPRQAQNAFETAASNDGIRELAYEMFAFADASEVQRTANERLVRLIVRSRKEKAAAGFADKLAATFAKSMQSLGSSSPQASVRLLGPAEAPVYRLKGYYRFHFQLQSSNSSALHDLLRRVLAPLRPSAGVEFAADVDPLNML